MPLSLLLGATDNGVAVAVITGAATVITGLGVALLQISRLSRKADATDAKASAIQVQVDGQMSKILEQLQEAEAGRREAEIKLAEMKARHPDEPI